MIKLVLFNMVLASNNYLEAFDTAGKLLYNNSQLKLNIDNYTYYLEYNLINKDFKPIVGTTFKLLDIAIKQKIEWRYTW
jgi:hypothetical protein